MWLNLGVALLLLTQTSSLQMKGRGSVVNLHRTGFPQLCQEIGMRGYLLGPERRQKSLTTRMMSSTDEDMDMDEYKRLRKQQEFEEFESKSAELDALRARIANMAKEQEMGEAEPWMPVATTSESVKAASKSGLPEMTPAMKNIASVLGDDRDDDEEDLDDMEDWVDPLEELPFWQQLFEESKRVDWPAPGKVAKTLGYVYGGMAGAAPGLAATAAI